MLAPGDFDDIKITHSPKNDIKHFSPKIKVFCVKCDVFPVKSRIRNLIAKKLGVSAEPFFYSQFSGLNS